MTFNDHLTEIHRTISIKDEDREPYTSMFHEISRWLTNGLCKVDPLFKKMFNGTQLFGSYPNRVRIITPKEFDVSILLKVPYALDLVTNPIYPGFARISRPQNLATEFDRDIFTNNSLAREKVKSWISRLIKLVLNAPPAGYSISYTCCNVAHNIYAKELKEPYKIISIDFVPSIEIDEEDITPAITLNKLDEKKGYMKTFLAIPIHATGIRNRYNRTRNMFRLANPEAERDKIWDKQNLKVVYRLLKSLRDKHDLKRLKSYFLTAIFLWEVEKQPNNFWQRSIEFIFFHMLNILIGFMQRDDLPFYWDPDSNLLVILKQRQLIKYEKILSEIYADLMDISVRPSSYEEVASFFKLHE